MAFSKKIQVEEQFFPGAFRVAPTAMERVLLSLLGPLEIAIATELVGNGKIRLQDAPEHLLIKLLLEWFRGLQNGIGIRVFGLQIVDDLGVLFAAKPGVMIDPAVAMQ